MRNMCRVREICRVGRGKRVPPNANRFGVGGTRCALPTLLMLVAVISCNVAVAADAPGWKGVDETVIEKVATEAGHPPQRPLLDTEQGDLLLFLFLTAGAIGGFIGGYSFRTLFPPRAKSDDVRGREGGGSPHA
jgi:ABC-type cobalt transport system substrate-binding protein